MFRKGGHKIQNPFNNWILYALFLVKYYYVFVSSEQLVSFVLVHLVEFCLTHSCIRNSLTCILCTLIEGGAAVGQQVNTCRWSLFPVDITSFVFFSFVNFSYDSENTTHFNICLFIASFLRPLRVHTRYSPPSKTN